MIKTKGKVIALAVMFMFGAVFAYAQAESPASNTSLATFGEMGTDVDLFLDTVGYKDMEMDNFFLFSRFGANIPQARLDLGVAFNVGDLYFGVWYDGNVIGQSNGDSQSGERWLAAPNPAEANSRRGEMIEVSARSKANPSATYGLLVGLREMGMGFKFTFVDDLSITSTGTFPSGNSFSETLRGSQTFALEFGGEIGPLQKVGFSMPIVSNRRESTTLTQGIPGLGGGSVSYQTRTLNAAGTAITSQAGLLAADGNYVQPDLYVQLGFGALSVENNLRLRIYGTPSVAFRGTASDNLPGVGFSNVTYDASHRTGSAHGHDLLNIWDERFWLENVVSPSFNINNNAEGEEAQRLTFSATAALPLTLRFTGNSLNVRRDRYGNEPNFDLSGDRPSSYSINFYEGSGFHLGIAPVVTAGVSFQVAAPFAVNAGIQADLFSWSMDVTSTERKALNANDADRLSQIPGGTFSGLAPSTETSYTTFNFSYPQLSLAAGFSFNVVDRALVDLVFIRYANPTAAGTIYKAIGDGIGSGDTSIVLSVKF
jgi:hypothetical protein